MTNKVNVVIAVTGASGVVLGKKCLSITSSLPDVCTHLVITTAAHRVITHELGPRGAASFLELADVIHEPDDIGAHIASGSFPTAGMVIAPCSLHTAMALAAGLGGNLVERAGQVHLKERRALVVMLRESPLASHHLENLHRLSCSGAIIMPASPRYYLFPKSVDMMLQDMAEKALSPLQLPGFTPKIWSPE